MQGNFGEAHGDVGESVPFSELTRKNDRQDFVTYAGWLSLQHAVEDMPIPPTRDHFAAAYEAGVGPSSRVVQETVGIGELQKELGFVMSPVISRWTREQFLENGRWMSHVLGSGEHPVMPRGPEVNQFSMLHLSPNTRNIKRMFGNMDNYQHELGFVSQATLETWTDKDWIDNGVWLSHMLGSPDEPIMPTQAYVHEASKLGLVPTLDSIQDKYLDGLIEYQERIGFSNPQRYKNWSLRDYIVYGARMSETIGNKRPSSQMYDDANDGPSANSIIKRFGSVINFHERLGFVDYEHFNYDQVLAFGVRWLRDHNGESISNTTIKEVYQDGKGPSLWRIRIHFETLGNFWEAAHAALPAYRALEDSLIAIQYNSHKVARHLLRDFTLDDEYSDAKVTQMEQLSILQKSGCKVVKLTEMFERSRATARWVADDFLYFGQLAFGTDDIDQESALLRLRYLDQVGLSPYLDELTDVFGSLETFLKQCLTNS